MGAADMFDEALEWEGQPEPGDLELLQSLVWRITDAPPDSEGWPVLGDDVTISADEAEAINRALDACS